MTRFNTVFLAIATVAFVAILTSVAGLVCDQTMVGKTYPYENPLYYYTCKNPTTEQIISCPIGTGYISNGTLTGCVAWQLWSCTSKAAPPPCSATCLGYLFPTANPQTYYLCTGVGKYSLQNCPTGTAYNPTVSTNNVTVGCTNWSSWWASCPY